MTRFNLASVAKYCCFSSPPPPRFGKIVSTKAILDKTTNKCKGEVMKKSVSRFNAHAGQRGLNVTLHITDLSRQSKTTQTILKHLFTLQLKMIISSQCRYSRRHFVFLSASASQAPHWRHLGGVGMKRATQDTHTHTLQCRVEHLRTFTPGCTSSLSPQATALWTLTVRPRLRRP